VRQNTERLLGRAATPAYRPELTPGYLVRDLATSVMGFFVGQGALRAVRGALGQATTGSALVSSGGLSGQQAAAAAARGITAGALGTMVATSLGTQFAFTLLDWTLSNHLGPPIERNVNRVLGFEQGRTSRSAKDGTIPTHMMKMDAEQAARNFGRNAANSSVYAITSATIGAQIARSVVAAVPGAGGALLGAVGSALVSSVFTGVWDSWMGGRAASAAQHGVRGIKRALGKPVSAAPPGDVVLVPGDRLAKSLRGVMVPFTTAAFTGQNAAFLRSITPSRPG